MSVQLNKTQENTYKDFICKELTERIGQSLLNEKKGLLYETFGYHDEEPPHSIVSRKLTEVRLNDFGLWGCGVREKYITKIQNFCDVIKDENDNVFLFLQFTTSTVQDRKNEFSTKIWTMSDLKQSDYFSGYIDEHGKPFNTVERNIIVKGQKKTQNTAFYVSHYYYYEQNFVRHEFLDSYYGKNYFSEEDVNLCTKCPCYLLKKKTDIINKSGKNWAIVLQLKRPYIVKMI